MPSTIAAQLIACLERANDAFVLLDREWRVVRANAALAALVERPADAVLGMSLWALFPGVSERQREALVRAAGGGSHQELEELQAWQAPSGIWIEARVSASPAGVLLLLTDATGRRRAIAERAQIEEVLRASEEAHRFLTESVPVQVWTARPDGLLDHVNRQVVEYFGKTSEEVLADGWQHVTHPADLPAVIERWGASLASGEPYEVEFRLRRADGEYRWHLGRARAMRDASGAVVRWFGSNTDIDDQRRAVATYRFMIEASSVLAASLDYETTMASVARLVVPQLADWCGVELVEHGQLRSVAVAHVDPSKVALARELSERWPVDPNARTGPPNVARTGKAEMIPQIDDALLVMAARDAEHLRIIRELGLTSSMCVPLRARDRTLGVISLVAAEPGRHFDAEDLRIAEELARRCAMAIDNAMLLRQAQDAEQEMRLLNEDLERRVGERTVDVKRAKDRAEEAHARLKEVDTMKDEFLDALSYQLASPINAVIGYTELLLEGSDGSLREEQRRYVRRITASSKVLLSLVHDLLDMSRMSAGKFELELTPVDPGALAREVLSGLEPLTEMQGLRVVSRISAALPEVAGDGQRIEQVIANVLNNAIQLTSAGGLIRLAVEQSGEMIRFEVQHTGVSLSPVELERIFRRFTHLGGAWLGLSIAQRVVEAHGGNMGVEANQGGGNTFWFTIPAVSADSLGLD